MERAIKAHKQTPYFKSTMELNPENDLVGYIGQAGTIEWVESQGFVVPHGGYYNEERKGDNGDFEWRYEKCDIKSSPMNDPKKFPRVYANSGLLLKEGTKKVDRLVFVKVNFLDKKFFIVGVIRWNSFMKKAKVFESENKRYSCRRIKVKQLDEGFDDFIFGVAKS